MRFLMDIFRELKVDDPGLKLMFSCYDQRKAFPSVVRVLVYHIMIKLGIPPKMVRLFRMLHEH